ncbi:MAG TPA: hypothetical protein VLF63_03660 [Patescibacteria group bacterium]|nr:hypothetical protein [Patescibacteria group bacterium]
MERNINILPPFITGSIDINRLLREAINIDDNLHQLQLRESGSQVKLAKTSMLMDKLVDNYKLNLLKSEDRQKLITFLQKIKNDAPKVHMSFSSDPTPSFLEQIVSWLRNNVHQEVLLSVGLQPTIGAGCILRTTNKYFDFSLIENLKKNNKMLLNKITELNNPNNGQNQVLAQPEVAASE